jgi:hypothetical protein
MDSPKRFCCAAEPSGLWTVWDGALNTPATLDGSALEHLAQDRAESARNMLESIYGNQLDATSMRAARLTELLPERDFAMTPRSQPSQIAKLLGNATGRQSS